jgi:tetratricopeptide (TPR) repeat protein
LRTPAALERLQALHRERDNLRTALSRALDDTGNHRVEAGLRLASALLNFWHTQSFHNEGYAWLEKGLSASAGDLVDPSVRAKACFSAGHLILPLGRIAEARQWTQESLAIYRSIEDSRGVVMAQSMLGEISAWNGSLAEASELGKASVALCQSLDDTWLLAWVLCRLGMGFFYLDEDALARPLLEKSLAIFERLGDPLQVGDHLITLGTIAYNQGDLCEASAYYQKDLASAQAKQSKWTEATVLHRLGIVAYEKGDYEQMRALLQESASIHREIGSFLYEISLSLLGIAEINLAKHRQAARHLEESLQLSTAPYDVAFSLIGIARIALQNNQPWIAAQLLGACQRHIEVEAMQFGRVGKKEYERALVELDAQLDAQACEQAMSAGQAMTLEQAVAYALEVADE